MHGRHQTIDGAGPVVDDFGKGREAVWRMSMSKVYLSSLTLNINTGASAEGAEMITFFMPPLGPFL